MNAVATGVLLVNLGTPDAPTVTAVRRYLREFLSDPRVVEIPRLLWQPLLQGVILPIRAKHSATLYQKIWTSEGSPLLTYSKKLARALQTRLANIKKPLLTVELGMRYGNPSIASALLKLKKAGCDKIIVLPLFPQYSATTTASIFDKLAEIIKTQRDIPALHFIKQYYDHPLYIQAIADSIQAHWRQNQRRDFLLFSFHGLPQRYVDLGDPYQQQCYRTAQWIAEKLALSTEQYKVVFQSRFGLAQWLQPYCNKTLQALPKQGIKQITIVCPGFAVDCLETLEEINQTNRELFLKAGGEAFFYVPALNDALQQVALQEELILNSIDA